MSKRLLSVLLTVALQPIIGFASEDQIRQVLLDCCGKRGYATIAECDMDKKAQEACAMEAANTKIQIREAATNEDASFKFGSPEVEAIMKQSENGRESDAKF